MHHYFTYQHQFEYINVHAWNLHATNFFKLAWFVILSFTCYFFSLMTQHMFFHSKACFKCFFTFFWIYKRGVLSESLVDSPIKSFFRYFTTYHFWCVRFLLKKILMDFLRLQILLKHGTALAYWSTYWINVAIWNNMV